MGGFRGKWRTGGLAACLALVVSGAWLTDAVARVAESGAEVAVRRVFRQRDFGVLQMDPSGGVRVRAVGFGRVPEVGDRYAVADGAGFVGLWVVEEVTLRGCDSARHFEVIGRFRGATPRDAVGERLALGPLAQGAPGRVRTVMDPKAAKEEGVRPLIGVDLGDDDDVDVMLVSRPCPAALGEDGACLETRVTDDGASWRVLATLPLRDCT